MSSPRPVILCIMDGWGLRADTAANAVALADTPTFDRVMRDCPNATLAAHGPAVGLPEGQMGNSEVGHMTIGAGRTIWMDLPRIDNAIADGSFATNPALVDFIARLKASGGCAHLCGLTSPGGVHAHQRHIVQACKVLRAQGIPVKVHALTDGRDVAPSSARDQIAAFEADLPAGAEIATLTGRFFAMDRDNRWDRVEEAYRAMAEGKGKAAPSADAAIAAAYAAGETDEFIAPSVIGGYGGMAAAGDGLLFLNFRADRAREILAAFLDPAFDGFDRRAPQFAAACGMVQYSERHAAWMSAMFPPQDIPNTLGHWAATHGLRQFRIAETEKYPHVTFFLNGGEEAQEEGEGRLMPPSPKVKTYDMAPEMSAQEVTDGVIAAIRDGFDLIVVNFANPDMVGHTGDLDAAKRACTAVDTGVGTILGVLAEVGGAMVLTADHGNCEMMIDPETGGPHTAHTLNPVPVVLIGGPAGARLHSGKLSDLAPTLLDLLGLPKPDEMTGATLIERP